jgi:hypothetical protein
MSPILAPSPRPTPDDFETLAAEALAALQAIGKTIPLDDVSAQDALASRAANRCPTPAIAIAATVVEQTPARFTDFSAEAMRSAIAYEQAMAPLAVQMNLLSQRITRTLQKRRGDAATQTLVLYQSLKVLARLSPAEPTRTQEREIASLLIKNRKPRATTVTKKEVKASATGLRKVKRARAKAAQAAVTNQAAAEAAKEAGIAASPTTPPAPQAGASVPFNPPTTTPVAVSH